MVKAVKYTQRVGDAIRKADQLPTVVPGGLMRKGTPPTSGGAGKLTPVQLTAKTNYNTYVGNVYGNGRDATATATGATIRIDVINETETITGLSTTAANFPAWKQTWAGASQWTVDANVWRGS